MEKRVGRPRTSFERRVFPRLILRPPPTGHDPLGRPLVGPCLIWTGKTSRGYGSVWDPDRGATGGDVRVHRLLYEMFVGPIRYQLDHLCRVKNCASPAHVEDVTGSENLLRRPPRTTPPKRRTKSPRCIRGHEYSDQNTRLERQRNGDFARKCRTCDRDRAREARHARNGGPPRPKTHCPHGHPYDDGNTYISPTGGRFCRTCGRRATRIYRDRKMAENRARQTSQKQVASR